MRREDVDWQQDLRSVFTDVSPQLLAMLNCTSSITDYAEQHYGGIRVQRVAEMWQQANVDEMQWLACDDNINIFTREVAIYRREQLWWRGFSVIPESTTEGIGQGLLQLGDSALGHFLFRHRQQLQRSTMVFAASEQGILRRSMFYLAQRPLLLTEFFLEPMINDINNGATAE